MTFSCPHLKKTSTERYQDRLRKFDFDPSPPRRPSEKRGGEDPQLPCRVLAEIHGVTIPKLLDRYEREFSESEGDCKYPADQVVFLGSSGRGLPLDAFPEIQVRTFQRSASQIRRARRAVRIALYDLRTAVLRDRHRDRTKETQVPVVVPMKKLKNGAWRGLSYGRVREAIQLLKDAGWIRVVSGIRRKYAPMAWRKSQQPRTGKKDFATELQFTEAFREKIEALEAQKRDLGGGEKLHEREAVVIKDENKRPIQPQTEEDQRVVEETRAFLDTHNARWQSLDVTVKVPFEAANAVRREKPDAPDGDVEAIRWLVGRGGLQWESRVEDECVIFEVPRRALRHRRIFVRSSTEFGGRFYAGWQNLPSLFRPFIHVNGQKTTTLDYDNLHIRMAYDTKVREQYEEDGTTPKDEDFLEGDAYDIAEQLPDEIRDAIPAKVLRKVVKVVLNTEINAATTQAAVQCYHNRSWDALGPDWSVVFESPFFRTRLFREIRGALKERHASVAMGSDVGIRFQRMDSEMVKFVLEKAPFPVLPVHDGFVCPMGCRVSLRKWMRRAYREFVFGSQLPGIFCKPIGVSQEEWEPQEDDDGGDDGILCDINCQCGVSRSCQYDGLVDASRDDLRVLIDDRDPLQAMQLWVWDEFGMRASCWDDFQYVLGTQWMGTDDGGERKKNGSFHTGSQTLLRLFERLHPDLSFFSNPPSHA